MKGEPPMNPRALHVDTQPPLTSPLPVDLGSGGVINLGNGVTMSASIKELSAALAQAQGKMRAANKNKTNPAYKGYRYADLDSCLDVLRPILSENGLALMQWPSAQGSHVTVRTILSHTSGQFVTGELTLIAKDPSAQSVGSAITYARRYALATVGLTTDEDDDANAATPEKEPSKTAAAKTSTPEKPAAAPRTRAHEAAAKSLEMFDQPAPKAAAAELPVIYLGKDEEQKHELVVLCAKAKVPKEQWVEIHSLMVGQPMSNASKVIERHIAKDAQNGF